MPARWFCRPWPHVTWYGSTSAQLDKRVEQALGGGVMVAPVALQAKAKLASGLYAQNFHAIDCMSGSRCPPGADAPVAEDGRRYHPTNLQFLKSTVAKATSRKRGCI